MPLLIALFVGVAVLAHTAPFPFLFEAFRPSRSVWHVTPAPGTPPTIYLTFDDGPNPVWTPPLLDALRAQGVQATFFLIDDHITPETAPIVRRIADEGHAIGLHSGTRARMVDEPEALAAWLGDYADRLEAITTEPPCRLFRPHAGWRSSTMYEGLEEADFTLAGWSWGMWDWDWGRDRSADRLAGKILKKASPGDIIVIHDGHHKDPRADRRHAGETVTRLVPLLRQKGYQFGTLCDPDTGAPPTDVRR
jgi:peptidoglycan/xylan/chitin deacetylase (PgdA/CDA1 family)